MKLSPATGSAGGPPAGSSGERGAAEPAAFPVDEVSERKALPALMPSFALANKETSRVMTQVASPPPHLGWHSRGFLPHWDHPGMIQGLTYRLHDAVPAELVQRWKGELGLRTGSAGDPPADSSHERGAAGPAALPVADESAATDRRYPELAKRIARYEDAGHGACWLRDERIGRLVEANLLHFDGQRYRLLAWCIMPNHVHVLVESREGWPLADLVHSWKSYTAHEANRILNHRGEFWQREYYDRYIRNAEHYLQAMRYIEDNPVKARLVAHPAAWPWSSSKFRVTGSAGGPPAGSSHKRRAAGPAALPAGVSRKR